MIEKGRNQFVPDYASPPGATLLETIQALGMTRSQLARRIGKHKEELTAIIKGSRTITPETALQLERALGVTADFWTSRQCQYDEAMARADERRRLRSHAGWLKKMPVRDMIRLKWIEAQEDVIAQLQAVLNFFGVTSPDEWDVMWLSHDVRFRVSAAFHADPYAISAWLRRGEVLARTERCAPYDEGRFREALNRARALTATPPGVFVPELARICREVGVAVVFVPELPKTRASGATHWLSPDKAIIQLSLRYKTDDQLWFSFFHEAGHILLHGKRDAFLEGYDEKSAKEREADAFAAESLIPATRLKAFAARRRFSRTAVVTFASSIGVAPGIVVGRLQHDGHLGYATNCNALKLRLQWSRETRERNDESRK